jgi:hypothetical protein
VTLVRTYISEEHIALGTANVVPSSLVLFALMM